MRKILLLAALTCTASCTVGGLAGLGSFAGGGFGAGLGGLTMGRSDPDAEAALQHMAATPSQRPATAPIVVAIRGAGEAAHRGDCGTVVMLAPVVRDLDADLYRDVFLEDKAIATCMQIR